MSNLQRIMLIGPPGSGKTTLGRKLSQELNLPLHHVDRLFFEAGWEERCTEEFLRDHEEILAQDRWILDGNAVRHLAPRAARAELLIILQPSRLRCLIRIVRRWWRHRNQPRADRPDNCPETIRWRLLKYLWSWDRRYAAQIHQLIEENPHLEVMRR